jgi:hypothetical protein
MLLWGIGLVFYGLGTFSEAYLALAYHPAILRLWYLSGALLTPAWLGQGTVYLLLRPRRLANGLMVALAALSALAALKVFTAPLMDIPFNTALPVSAQYQPILTRDSLTILLLIVLTLYGTTGLVGGAIYSSYLYWRKRILPNRVVGNILIAVGALLPATAGAQVANNLGVDWLYLSELLGAVIMFAGFSLAATAAESLRPRAAEAVA